MRNQRPFLEGNHKPLLFMYLHPTTPSPTLLPTHQPPPNLDLVENFKPLPHNDLRPNLKKYLTMTLTCVDHRYILISSGWLMWSRPSEITPYLGGLKDGRAAIPRQSQRLCHRDGRGMPSGCRPSTASLPQVDEPRGRARHARCQ